MTCDVTTLSAFVPSLLSARDEIVFSEKPLDNEQYAHLIADQCHDSEDEDVQAGSKGGMGGIGGIGEKTYSPTISKIIAYFLEAITIIYPSQASVLSTGRSAPFIRYLRQKGM